MSKRHLALLLCGCMCLFSFTAFCQFNAREQVLDIMSMKVPDSVKLRLLLNKASTAGDSSTLLFLREARRLSVSLNATDGSEYNLNTLTASYYQKIQKYDSAEFYYVKNLEKVLSTNDAAKIGETYRRLGSVAHSRGLFQQAIESNTHSLEYFEKLHDSNGIAAALDALGLDYIRINQPSKTIELLTRAISIAKSTRNKSLLAKLYNTIGSAYADMNRDSLVLHYQQQALAIYKESHDLKGLINTSINLGQLYEKRKEFTEAEKQYTAAAGFGYQLNDLRDLATIYYNLGDLYFKMNNKSEASRVQDSSVKYAQLAGDHLVLSKAYKQKSIILYENGKYKEGYEYFKKYSSINDSIYNVNMQSSITELQNRVETEKLERRLQEERFANVKRNFWIAGIIILVAATVLLLISWYKRQKLQEEKKFHQAIIAQQDLATKAVIEAEENERKRIAGDLHDGVGQMMSAAKMNLSSFESKAYFRSPEERLAFDKIITLVDDSCTEVRNVSHNMMPNALLKSGLANAIKEFIEKIDSRKLKVNLHAEGLNERLDKNVETVLYRVIQECVNNVIRHSAANHLDISLIRDNEGISATIEDNGKGFDIKQKDKFDGIGLKNIETRIQYLKGTIDFDSRPGRGTLVAIHVPLS